MEHYELYFDGHPSHAESRTIHHPSYLHSNVSLSLFTGKVFEKRTHFMERYPVCPCNRCQTRMKHGMRPIPFFSPNHKTRPSGMRILVFDTETTGLPKYRNASVSDSDAWPYIVQWSWLVFDVDTQSIVNVHDHIIKLPPSIRIPEESTAIHGITNDMMRTKGKLFKYALTNFIADYERCDYIVAHNIEFDRKMVEAECFRHHLPVNYVWSRKRVKEYCTMKRTKSLCGMKGILRYGENKGQQYIRYPKLIELHQTLFDTNTNKTPLNHLHNSLMDILVCFRCFYVLVFEKDPMEYKNVVLGMYQEWEKIYGVSYMKMLKRIVVQV